MIDSSRLSHSFATALKDRPHGIPVQPNRSLPLRPPPPLPARISLAKSAKNSPINQVSSSSRSLEKNGKAEARCKDNSNVHSSGLDKMGINFYDSKDKEDKRKDETLNRKTPKELNKSRHAKSLDIEESSHESVNSAKRRKSYEYETGLHRQSDKKNADRTKSGDKKLRYKEYCTKKRKSSSVGEDSDSSRKSESPEVKNSDSRISTVKFNTVNSHAETQQLVVKSKNFDKLESSGSSLPVIYKYRNSPCSSPKLTAKSSDSDSPDIDDKSNWKQTSSNTYRMILPKSQIIPQCPVAIPIEVAHALNQGESTNGDCISPIKPKINAVEPNKTIHSKPIGDIENTLPSMPSLEDMIQADNLKSQSPKKRGSFRNPDANVAAELDDVIIKPKLSDLNTGQEIQANNTDAGVDSTNFDQPHGNESIVNLTTVLKIRIPGRSPEVIIVSTPPIMAGSKTQCVDNDNFKEITDSVSLSNSVEPVSALPKEMEDVNLRKRTSAEEIKNTTKIQTTGTFVVPRDSQEKCKNPLAKEEPQYVLQHKSPSEFAVVIKDSGLPQNEDPSQKCEEDESVDKKLLETTTNPKTRSKVDEDKVRYRKNNHISMLQELFKEESILKFQVTQTSDPILLKRLQQNLNCAKKKIENLQKQLSRITSLQYSDIESTQSRIKVRQDLVEPLPSPEPVEPASQSPVQANGETEQISAGRSPAVSFHDVITLSESDSTSSGDETDDACAKSLDDAKYPLQSVIPKPELKALNLTEKHYEPTDTPRIPSPKCDLKVDGNLDQFKTQESNPQPNMVCANPESTHNNIEHLNKNLALVSERVPPARTSNIMKSIPPLIRDRGNFTPNNSNSFTNQTCPSEQQGVLNLSLGSTKLDKDMSKPSCNCSSCKRSNPATQTDNRAKIDENSFLPATVNDMCNINAACRPAVLENANSHPVPNYPVHRPDYRTKENAPSMFSRDNGGANINLSSPLQGHSALPLPTTYYRNLTAQGYPIPVEPSPNQTMQWANQHPQSKSDVQFTPDQDNLSQSSILASHLLKPQIQEAAKFSNPITMNSLAQSKEAVQTNTPKQPITNHVINAQFPTLGNWVAQMTRESIIKKTVNNNPASVPINYTHPTIDHGYKNSHTSGSDMYKMAATAVDPRHPIQSMANMTQWGPAGAWIEQPRSMPGHPNQRSSAHHPYRRDHPNPQNSHNMRLPPYPGSEVYTRYATQPHPQAVPRPQTNRNTENANQFSLNQQNVRQYHSQAAMKRPTVPEVYPNQGNAGPMVNPVAMMSQLYPQQPPPYTQATLSLWPMTADNYSKNYVNPRYNGYTYNVPNKSVDDLMGFRQTNKNHNPLVQPQREPFTTHNHLISNDKVRPAMYNIATTLNNVGQDVRNSEALDIGSSYAASHLAQVHKSPDRSSTLQCSRCGMAGPKFNCNGCETAFYCNEHCQAQHWNTHYLECPKKMPKLKKVS